MRKHRRTTNRYHENIRPPRMGDVGKVKDCLPRKGKHMQGTVGWEEGIGFYCQPSHLFGGQVDNPIKTPIIFIKEKEEI